MNRIPFTLAVAAAIFAPAAMAAGGKALYEDNCLICHGPEGGGNVGLAPPLKGNKFVLESDGKVIAELIVKGRMGADKRYKEFAAPMPPLPMPADDLAAIAAFIKGDLQK